MSEMNLIERIRRGDREAASAFVDRHYDRIFRMLKQMTRHEADAADLAQETFLAAVKGINGFRGEASVTTWLHRIAYRLARKRRPQREILEPAVSSRFDEEVDSAIWLERALQKLPPETRDAFVLFELQGLTVEEVSQTMECPVGTTKSRLHHARRMLREVWEREALTGDRT